jgi:hypothetical protein
VTNPLFQIITETIVHIFKGFLLTICLAAMWLSAPVRSAAGEIKHAEFDKLHKELSSAREPWQSLPWQLSLVEARNKAARDNKPIYMLCRSGHPLGCV